MKWLGGCGYWQTMDGTTKARKYYWVARENNGSYVVGYFAFNRDVQRRGISFESLSEAKNYCKTLDDSTLVIEAVNA
jgi:RimJ/RimL family protein N-acetyltransferase